MNKINRYANIAFYIQMILALSACAIGLVHHSFDFNVQFSDPNVQILDFQYGSSRVTVAAPKYLVDQGTAILSGSSTGLMRKGTYLYVKWRLKDSGKIYEDRVDLRDRFPYDIEHQTVTFTINGSQLYIYLVLPTHRPNSWPVIGPKLYQRSKVIEIYPNDQAKNDRYILEKI